MTIGTFRKLILDVIALGLENFEADLGVPMESLAWPPPGEGAGYLVVEIASRHIREWLESLLG